MPRARGRKPSDFQVAPELSSEYTEGPNALEFSMDAILRRERRRILIVAAASVFMICVVSIVAISNLLNEVQKTIRYNALETERAIRQVYEAMDPVWGPNGSPRPGDSRVWEARCADQRQPIGGTCVAIETVGTDPVQLQNFGVNQASKQWQCAWTRPVLSATVLPLCPKVGP
jgi:hypothetical protein